MIAHILSSLEEETRANAIVNLNLEGTFLNVLKGCFIKSFEYATLCRGGLMEGSFFFLAPVLRGICEDYIILRFLQIKKNEEERDKILLNKAKSLIFESVKKQCKFFEKKRPFQPVVKAIPEFFSLKVNLPPTGNMAREVGLNDLYDFMFAVTSDVVHFNPRVIMRNAWGKDKHQFKHSTKNFDLYYKNFCCTYSSYLLCEFAKAFQSELKLSRNYLAHISELEKDLNEQLRWPEAVTFEEMNLKKPNDIMRILLKSIYESKESGDSTVE